MNLLGQRMISLVTGADHLVSGLKDSLLPTRTCLLLLLFGSSLLAFGQSGNVSAATADQPSPPSAKPAFDYQERQPDELKQELDADAIELSKIPADPLIQPDPVAPILRPINKLVDLQYSLATVEVWRDLYLSQPVCDHNAGRGPARSTQRTPRFHRSVECLRS